jgi:hypothetical protein
LISTFLWSNYIHLSMFIHSISMLIFVISHLVISTEAAEADDPSPPQA